MTVAAGLLMAALAACSSEGGVKSATDPEPTPDPPSTSSAAAGPCTYTPDTAPAAKEVEPPSGEPIAQDNTSVVVTTSAGTLNIVLDGKGRPCTVNSFLSLAAQGYFDQTNCHRLTTEGIWVLQCGDPTATGTGGPGYSFADELKGSETYPAGTLAMANAGPNTNGSQFFLVYKDSPLPPAYAVFGKLDAASIKVVQAIGAAGTAEGGPDGSPKTPVEIASVARR